MSEGFIILRAVDFAAKYHANQRRKCPEATPYINHCIAVARLVASSQRAWPPVVAAAVLHDVVEDTPATLQDVENAFGPEIAAMVAQAVQIGAQTKAPGALHSLPGSQIDQTCRQVRQFVFIGHFSACWVVRGAHSRLRGLGVA